MGENDAVLIGKDEIAGFLRVSPRKVDEWRGKYPDMPVFCESKGSRLCAVKDDLQRWQVSLFKQKTGVCQ